MTKQCRGPIATSSRTCIANGLATFVSLVSFGGCWPVEGGTGRIKGERRGLTLHDGPYCALAFNIMGVVDTDSG